LLQRGANVQAKGKNGWTALNWASSKGHMAVVQLLTVAAKSSSLSPQGVQLPPRPHSSNGTPMQTPYYNPLQQTPQFNQFMRPPPNVMQMPGFGNNPGAQFYPTTAVQPGHLPGLQQNTLQSSWAPQRNTMMPEFIAYAGDYQLSYAQPSGPGPNPWISYAGS
jgi:ankyrin repeat protein